MNTTARAHIMTLMRHHILDLLHRRFPQAYSRPALLAELRPLFPTENQTWLNDAASEQVQILKYSGLVRPAAGGVTLTERGRADRQQAQRFLNKHGDSPEAS